MIEVTTPSSRCEMKWPGTAGRTLKNEPTLPRCSKSSISRGSGASVTQSL
jgi:hypothetical protein